MRALDRASIAVIGAMVLCLFFGLSMWFEWRIEQTNTKLYDAIRSEHRKLISEIAQDHRELANEMHQSRTKSVEDMIKSEHRKLVREIAQDHRELANEMHQSRTKSVEDMIKSEHRKVANEMHQSRTKSVPPGADPALQHKHEENALQHPGPSQTVDQQRHVMHNCLSKYKKVPGRGCCCRAT